MSWRDKPDHNLTSADITAMCSEGNPVSVAGPPRGVSVYHCDNHNITFTGMGLQDVVCCGQATRRIA